MLQHIVCYQKFTYFRFEQRSASPEGKYYYFRPARSIFYSLVAQPIHLILE